MCDKIDHLGRVPDSDIPDACDLLIMESTYGDHKKLLNMSGPTVIIAGSGMCTGGRIVDYFKQGLRDAKNNV